LCRDCKVNSQSLEFLREQFNVEHFHAVVGEAVPVADGAFLVAVGAVLVSGGVYSLTGGAVPVSGGSLPATTA
jgi:hypothetical protein